MRPINIPSACSGKPRFELSDHVRPAGDVYHWDVRQTIRSSGTAASGILSPKVSAAFGPWAGTELYANWGLGFHSNSGLGINLAVDPFTGEAATASPAFARARGPSSGSGR